MKRTSRLGFRPTRIIHVGDWLHDLWLNMLKSLIQLDEDPQMVVELKHSRSLANFLSTNMLDFPVWKLVRSVLSICTFDINP